MNQTAYSPPIEGGHRKPRTLVLCFDGTANEFNHCNTNVVKLYSILKKDRPDLQLCYYQERKLNVTQAGVGTYFQPGAVSPFFRFAARVLDEAFAWYLSEHIMDGYKFLMQNYHEGDSVCIFGFSRGAYTARALAGMLHKVGLLSKDNFEQVAFAYKLYKSSSHRAHKLAIRFKRSFSREVPIEFLGVWDTVASVGLFSTRTLPFVGANNTIRVFRQALSLDERRAKFCPNLYHRPVSTPGPHSPQSEPLLKKMARALKIFTKPRRSRDTPHSALDSDSNGPGKKPGFKKDVKEVWFAGAHSDVGGGLAKDTESYALSNIPLRWMVREIANAECHIRFDEAALEAWNIPITTTMIERMPIEREVSDSTLLGDEQSPGKATSDKYHVAPEREENATTSTGASASTTWGKSVPAPSPSPQAEPSLDAKDAAQKMGDALRDNLFWWIVEIVPTYHEWQNEHDEWVGKWRLHLGRGRELPARPLFHESVKIRMDNPILKYSPRARYEMGTEVYVA
ncbi:hypothetical protein BJV78DRAFT_1275572 [Lactifluus subvellereus]|nr:hypothetical protein BJV78DRAFT_1275572 [Lactifluus subvellereus]